MRALFIIGCAIAISSGMTSGAFAGLTNNLALIKTSYVSNAILTAIELDAVVTLAKSSGIDPVAKVRTFHLLPSLIPGIEVIGAEEINGRHVSYETIEVFREGWALKTKPAGALSVILLVSFGSKGCRRIMR
jgi:hypothetical protein